MNSKERVYARMNGEPVDRIPNLNILMFLAAREIGASYSDYCQDYRLTVKGNIACAEKYGVDCVTIMSDPMKEAHDVGTSVVFPEDDVPYAKDILIKEKSDLKKLKPVKPEDGKRMSNNVNAVRMFKEELKDEIPIIGWVEGCLAEAADLMGVNELLVEVMDDMPFVSDLMEFCLEQALMYAKAQIDAGADFIGVGDAIASVAGPVIYEQLTMDFERRLLKGLQDMGAKTKLHICGNITPFLDKIPVDVIDVLDADWMVPLDKITAVCGESTSISGNYDPVEVLLQGTPQTIRDAVINCAKIGNSRYISAAGCEVPKFTPEENFLAVKEVLANMDIEHIAISTGELNV